MGGIRQAVGAYGEALGAEHLRGLGMRILSRNWRCPDGELDLVAVDDGVLVACEVKTRRGIGFGLPMEAVTDDKLRRLHRLAHQFRVAHGLVEPVRVDLLGVLAIPGRPVQIEHARGVG